jgi:hypothetical protein
MRSRTVRHRRRRRRHPPVSVVGPPRGDSQGTLILPSWPCKCFRIPIELYPCLTRFPAMINPLNAYLNLG